MCIRSLMRLAGPLALAGLFPLALLGQQPPVLPAKPSVVYKVQYPNDRLEMTVHSSRILTLERKIAQAHVNNPDVLEVTPLTPNQLQVSAKATGVTQLNVWDEDKKLFTIDVIIFDDVRELEMVLRNLFPTVALKVTPLKLTRDSQSVAISGFVDKPEHVDRIMRIAEQYYKKDNIVNNMSVGGCQQVLLHVRIMEVSRTKLRRLGFDWGKITGNSVVSSGPSGLLADYTDKAINPGNLIRSATPSTFAFSAVNGTSAFFGVLDALREDGLAKILAEPTLTTISGRPASFRAGGSFYIVPSGQNGGPPITVNYGTQLNFVPIVLGNGRIHLDVRSIISEPDASQPEQFQPALKDRSAETGAELQAGQTLAIAGLVQTRVEAHNRGLPWISELPYLGAAFRKVDERINEIELLIMITPELVEAMDANEVPPCGPGTQTTSPSDWELFMKGYLEVPNCCPSGGGNGESGPGGDGADGPPPDGMMGPGEQVPTPPPVDASDRGAAGSRPAGAAMARRRPAPPPDSAGPYNRYTRSKSNTAGDASPAGSRSGPPGFIGPVGYDVVK